MDRKELLEALALNYIVTKENNIVFEREDSNSYAIALGKLQGACMALNLDFEETERDLTIVTQSRRKVIAKIDKF